MDSKPLVENQERAFSECDPQDNTLGANNCQECKSLSPILTHILTHLVDSALHKNNNEIIIKQNGFRQKLTWHLECEYCSYKCFYPNEMSAHSEAKHAVSAHLSRKRTKSKHAQAPKVKTAKVHSKAPASTDKAKRVLSANNETNEEPVASVSCDTAPSNVVSDNDILDSVDEPVEKKEWQLILIEAVKNRPEIYERTHPQCNRENRWKMFAEVGQILQRHNIREVNGLVVDANFVQKKWKSFRDEFVRRSRKLRESEPGDKDRIKPLKYHDKLLFLESVVVD